MLKQTKEGLFFFYFYIMQNAIQKTILVVLLKNLVFNGNDKVAFDVNYAYNYAYLGTSMSSCMQLTCTCLTRITSTLTMTIFF